MRFLTRPSLLFLWLVCLLSIGPAAAVNEFLSETAALLGSNTNGIVGGLADVNADRQVDLLVINQDVRSVDALIMAKEQPAKRQRLTELPTSAKEGLVGIIPADYNGDSRLDLALVSGAKSGAGPVTVYIAYGKSKRLKFTPPAPLPKTFTDQPVLVDFNSDMIADLLGETTPGKMSVFLGQTGNNFSQQTYSGSQWEHPTFTGFVDLNGDNQPDILMRTKKSGSLFEVALKSRENTYDLSKTVSIPAIPRLKIVGSPVFQDFDGDGHIEILLPGCADTQCADSEIYMYKYSAKKWTKVTVNFQSHNAETWSFVPPTKNPLTGVAPLPILLHVGDVDGDSLPDLLAILSPRPSSTTASTAPNHRRVGLFLGSASGKYNLIFPRGADAIYNASLATIFDFRETGRLGILTVEGGNKPYLRAYMQGDAQDSYFLKVMVLSGRCGGSWDCPDGLTPYGLPVPGPIFTYDTERPDGGRQVAKGSQVTQTSYFALQAPYHVFGLGIFSNYIESMSVYLPNPPKKPNRESIVREKTFTFIVPKTQLVVIPYPLNQPSKWKSKLFLEPFKDKKVLFVAAALLGTIVVVAITIGILQWRERREDLQEKLQDAQKFHFDAM